ncbi:MAG TPA: DUF6448 family protein [Vicinamibacterales bacterium]|nr:DUF6448 family protein [Vicinamibacterales bacterium]
MTRRVVSTAAMAAAILLIAIPAFAHCDALDGPVVKTATVALQNGDVTPALRWVGHEQEAELRAAFEDARAVRGAGGRTRALADRYFFETAVRLHRQSEGEPYTGLKPAGSISEALADADRAIESGTVDRLADAFARRTTQERRSRFAEVLERRAHADESVEAGRRYVPAYVGFMHYIEEIGAPGAKGASDSHR